jgi:hypothetical protein
MTSTDRWQDALQALGPLEVQIDAALAAGDVASAVGLAYGGASQAAALVAEPAMCEDSATVHGVLVELAPLPLDTFDDGTLAENGAYVTLTYRSWNITQAEAERMAGEWANVVDWAVDSS